MCGEQHALYIEMGHIGGSPPRVRGTESFVDQSPPEIRITPACAGNSLNNQRNYYLSPDHPRVCGEQWNPPSIMQLNAGSPPRVRGTVCEYISRPFSSRITPACAGNSCFPSPQSITLTDHPRVCGEQIGNSCKLYPTGGSPPRVRGTVALSISLFGSTRITPACAGNSFEPRAIAWYHGDHPRVCGEQLFFSWLSSFVRGSPPRVRGTVFESPGGGGIKRITPACAGNSERVPPWQFSKTDHPRVCGEQDDE